MEWVLTAVGIYAIAIVTVALFIVLESVIILFTFCIFRCASRLQCLFKKHDYQPMRPGAAYNGKYKVIVRVEHVKCSRCSKIKRVL